MANLKQIFNQPIAQFKLSNNKNGEFHILGFIHFDKDKLQPNKPTDGFVQVLQPLHRHESKTFTKGAIHKDDVLNWDSIPKKIKVLVPSNELLGLKEKTSKK